MRYLISTLLSLLITAPAFASVESERDELILIQAHIDKLNYLIRRAEREADYRITRHFNYSALRADLRDIQSGIDVYLNPERLEPRPITPIGGDYITVPTYE
ncbi:hypothetical protein MACH09_45730 [Vibrio sp. MACH09]|uniref:integrative conjugative element protein, RAQPRD family n=1 Tax=Vibrio sp. MACH09 TaxID=3025122 RepID=UPI002794E024|nr:RAQPRD family integrative conjugative element protein [Vibrio sp. MACH09]GLO64065.1 hypothetical protein MACH09_45730 [Vibrio sp. MACH09]